MVLILFIRKIYVYSSKKSLNHKVNCKNRDSQEEDKEFENILNIHIFTIKYNIL